MASEWARKKVEQIVKLAECIHADDCGEPYGEGPCTCWVEEVWQEIAAALDEAREEGAQRERWECYRMISGYLHSFGCTGMSADQVSTAVALKHGIFERGPMRGPEEESACPCNPIDGKCVYCGRAEGE